jgi:UDP-glucose 4-epimerase
MKILVFGGTGFVGLNIAAALLVRGHTVTLFDRAGLPSAAARDFGSHTDRLTAIQGDITDRKAIEQVIAADHEAIILAAAITAGPEREAKDPEAIFRVNLLAQPTKHRLANDRWSDDLPQISVTVGGRSSPFLAVPSSERHLLER